MNWYVLFSLLPLLSCPMTGQGRGGDLAVLINCSRKKSKVIGLALLSGRAV